MKTIMITGGSSNSGKTTVTLGLLRAMKNRGMDLAPYKTGPDYIDSKYLELASGNRSGNLDLYMMGENGSKKALALNMKEYGLVEGAMGYFDGIYNTYQNSSYDISEKLDIPAILVYEAKGEMFSAIAKIKGMVDFAEGRIKGIIFNKCSPKIAKMLEEAVKEYVGIEVLGYLGIDKNFELPSRHLGLLQPHEIEDIEGKIDCIASSLEETVDIDRLVELMEKVESVDLEKQTKTGIKVGVAYDEAFSFYYSENLKLLEDMCELVYFSPLTDKKLPEDLDLIYIGGGYPELYKEELSSNINFLEDMRGFIASSGYIFAEGAGLMYLAEEIDGYKMVGALEAKVYMTDKTQKFGYTEMEFLEDNIVGFKGESLKGKEFHRSFLETDLKELLKVTKPKNPKTWKCGYAVDNIFAFYGHVHFLGNLEIIERFLNNIN